MNSCGKYTTIRLHSVEVNQTFHVLKMFYLYYFSISNTKDLPIIELTSNSSRETLEKPKGQSDMDNQEKLATSNTGHKMKTNKTKHTTQYVLDAGILNQAQIM